MAEESPLTLRVEELHSDQRLRWGHGERVLVESYLQRYPSLQSDTECVLQLINNEVVLREELEGRASLAEYLERFPQLHTQLEEMFEVHRALESDSVATVLGDDMPQPVAGWPVVDGYEILGELGRGGMGVVYRAKQTALGRLVALKVPRPGVLLSDELRERFVREGRAAAMLDHPNLVPVYEIGMVGPLFFIASAYCPGITLTQWLARRSESVPARLAAQLVATLAKAVQHAHERGVIHRDLKPSNVLLQWRPQPLAAGDNPTPDQPDAGFNVVPRITDFGLAKLTANVAGQADKEGGMRTQSGAVLGTPSYMAPEQTGGKNKEIDRAADIYALGALLYELLTGRPPFLGETVLDTLEQVRNQEPLPPHRLRPKLGRDLETICLKCLVKEPSKRYASAAALADDLHHYLTGEPIQARPVGRLNRLARWARRRPAAAALWTGGLAVLLAGLGLGLWLSSERDKRLRAAELALTEGETLRDQSSAKLDPALWERRGEAARRAEALLGQVTGAAELKGRVRQLLAEVEAEKRDLDMVERLEDIRFQVIEAKEGQIAIDSLLADTEYAAAFAWYGIDVEALTPEEAAKGIEARPIRKQLTAALDAWAFLRRTKKVEAKGWGRLLEIARLADPDAWRNRFRAALERLDRKTMLVLEAEAPIADLEPISLLLVGEALVAVGEPSRAVAWLGKAQRQYPGDSWLNQALGFHLREVRPTEALGFFRAVLALRPHKPGPHINLGTVLLAMGQVEEAIAAYRDAIRLHKNFPVAHYNLGYALKRQGRLNEAIDEYREAIRLNKNYLRAYCGLAAALYDKNDKNSIDEALAVSQAAIRLDKDYAEAHLSLGLALEAKHQLDEAIAEYRVAIRLKKDYGDGHLNLGKALVGKGKIAEAIVAFREAIRINKEDAEAHINLGLTFQSQGQFALALSLLKRGHELGSRRPGWRYPTAAMVRAAERLAELEDRLPALRKGEYQPRDSAERLELAQVCQFKNMHLAAARLYADAFNAKPALADDPRQGYRYNAACAATRAAAGQGEGAATLGDQERARWRKQARDWLQADLKIWTKTLGRTTPQGRAAIGKRLQHWQTDPDLASVRDDADLMELSDGERAVWRQLWADVRALQK